MLPAAKLQNRAHAMMQRLVQWRRPKFPIELRWNRLRFWGDSSFDPDNGNFVIRLSRNRIRTMGELEDTLIHEYAHVLAWFSNERQHHGPVWGVTYAAAYCAYYRTR